MFSSLLLDDGELTLHDIERLEDVPPQVVLASCSGAGALVASGEEVVSLAGAFLAIGARTVVAPLFTVSDRLTAGVMTEVYDTMATGRTLPEAFALARSSENPAMSFTAASFGIFGAS